MHEKNEPTNLEPVEQLLARAGEALLAQAPSQHRERRPSCPPLTKFPAGAAHGWEPPYADHTPDCPYCRKTMVMQWRQVPPSLLVLARYQAGLLRDHEAMRALLELDEAEPSRLQLRSRTVQLLGQTMALPQKLVTLFAPVEIGVWQNRETEREPIHVRAGDALLATLYERDRCLVARVEARGLAAPVRVRAEFIRTGLAPVVVEQELDDHGDLGVFSDIELLPLPAVFAPGAEVAGENGPRRGGCVLLVELIEE